MVYAKTMDEIVDGWCVDRKQNWANKFFQSYDHKVLPPFLSLTELIYATTI